jgi:GWxTD domain-containing protein
MTDNNNTIQPNNTLMKKILLIFTFALALTCGAEARKLSASLNFTTFFSPADGPYIETYLSVAGHSVVFNKNDNGMYRAAIEITMIFRRNDTVANFKKYELLSPEVADTAFVDFSFIDQQRIPLPAGKYDFEIRIGDRNMPAQVYKQNVPVEMYYNPQNVIVSGIQLVESFQPSSGESIISKNGYDLVPRVSNFYPADAGRLVFYAEIYNSVQVLGQNGRFLVSTYITPYESANKLEAFSRVKRQDNRDVNVVFSEFDISKLASGNYNLVIEARDAENKLLSMNSIFIQRSNPGYIPDYLHPDSLKLQNSFAWKIRSRDTLVDYIQSLRPIAAEYEKVFMDVGMKSAPTEVLQSYLFTFWQARSEINPEGAFKTYMEEVQKAEQLFGSRFGRGYKTDRGRVYLQYGPPDAINENPFDAGSISTLSDNQANAGVGGSVPYQIWHYYQLKNQRNKFFVFYNPHLVPKQYQLLHSDAQGELYNPMWQSQLRRVPIDNIDAGNPNTNPGF